jgi:hypothetical protein
MKYHKKPPIIILIEEDVEIVANKVDRGEDVVHIDEAHREEIMEKLVDVHDTLKRMYIFTFKQATLQQPKKTQKPPSQKEQEETMEIVVKGSNTFMVTQQML